MQNYLPRFLSYEEWQRNEREKLKPQMPWEISNKGGGATSRANNTGGSI